MADIKSPEERSRNMAAIKSKDTKPELYLRTELFHLGYRYRKNVNYIPGHPDVYLAKYRTAVFVNGCFWHRHAGCKYAYTPKSRTEFWNQKFKSNMLRDQKVYRKLEEEKFKCLVVWECTIRKMAHDEKYKEYALNQISVFLHSKIDTFCEI